MAAIGQSLNFTWDNASTNPVGTTTELLINGQIYSGYTDNTATIDVPIAPGQTIDAKARSIPPTGWKCLLNSNQDLNLCHNPYQVSTPECPLTLCQPSIYSNQVLVTIPKDPETVYATKTWTGLDTFITDNFNRANETPLSGNWYSKIGINLSNNRLVSTVSSDKFISIKTPTISANQFSEIKIIATPSFDFGPAVRVSSTNLTGYWLTANGDGTIILIVKFNNGALSVLSMVQSTVKLNDIIRLEINGNVLKGYVNGIQVTTVIDNSPIASGQPGLFIYDTSTLDDWKGGNL